MWLDSSLLFPYTTGKAWVFRGIVELGFAFSIAALLGRRMLGSPIRGRWDRVTRWLLGVILVFLVWSGLCNQLGIDPYRSFWSNWERMGGYLDYLHWALYLVCLLTIVTPRRVPYLLLNLFAVITLVSLLGLMDETRRAISSLGNPIYLGNLSVFGLFVGSYLLAQPGWGRVPRWLTGTLIVAAMAIMLLALYQTASRGPVLALAVGLVVGMATLLAHRGSHLFRVFGWAIVALCVLVALVSLSGLQRSLQQSDSLLVKRLTSISLQDQTTADRIENWSIALAAAQQRPWLGWGQDNYLIAFNEHYRAGAIDHARLWFDRAHNAYLDVLVAAGLPGLLLYLLMLGLPLYLLARTPGMGAMEKAALAGLLAAFLAKNVVGFDTFSSTLVWMHCVAVLVAMNRRPEPAPGTDSSLGTGSRIAYLAISAGLPLLALLAVYTLNLQAYRDNQRFARLMSRPLADITLPLAEIRAQPGYSRRYASTERLAVYDSVLRRLLRAKPGSYPAPARERLVEMAVELIDAAIAAQPRDYRIRYNGAMLLLRVGAIDEAIGRLEKLAEELPQRTAFWGALAKLYAATGQRAAAVNAQRTALNLNPDWN